MTGANAGEPTAPTLNDPEFGTTYHPYETFPVTWTAVSGASTYTLQEATDPSFPMSTTNNWDNQTTTSRTELFANPGTYYLRVRAVSADRSESVPSNVVTITVSYSAPVSAPPSPVAPTSGTFTLPVTLTWTNVPNPQGSGYEVEFSTRSDFGTVEQDDPLINPDPGSTTSFTFTSGLAGGTTYWRVRAAEGDDSADTSAETAWSAPANFTISTAPAAVVSDTPFTTDLGSGLSGQGEIQLSADAPSGGAVVTMTSSDPSALSVQSSVSIPAGVAGGPYQFTAGGVAAPTQVTITATLGSSSASSVVTVEPATLESIRVDPGVMPGGESPNTLLMLTGDAPPGGAVVSLSTDSPFVTVPATTTVVAGSPSAYVNLTTGEVSQNTTATVTATWNGVSVEATLTLTPQQAPAAVTLSPTTTSGTSGSSGVVKLAAEAASDGAVVNLSSSNPAVASVPAQLLFGSFGQVAGFTVTTQRVTTQTVVTISATAAGATVSTTLTLTPQAAPPPPPSGPTLSAVTVNPSTIRSGDKSTGTVILSAPAPSGGFAVALSSNNGSLVSLPSNVTVAAGATSVSFEIRTQNTASQVAVTITGSAGGVTKSATLTLTKH